MNESDALADVSTYINNFSTSVSIELRQIIFPVVPTAAINSYLAYFLTYTSPCQPFNAALLTSDTTTCAFVPVQLGASGGNTSGAFQAYEWLPQQNLSCYDCPNPIFLGDSTTNYTVRIRNTDSCSVVYPVRVRVLPNPSFESIEITESVCGGATGSIEARPVSGAEAPHTFQINNGTPQNNGTFNNLAAGEYTITLTNEHGCSIDSIVVVGEFNNVQAAFSVNPTTGAAPLDISITNQSQNASEHFWYFTDEDGNLLNQVTGHFGSAQCPVAGVYTLTLIAGNGAQHCNDTTAALIVVKEPFVVFAYTHVTNEANLYQVFISGVSEYDYKIYALDGKLVYEKNGSIEAAGNVDLWEISKLSSGMYVFRIKVKDLEGNEHEVDGKLVVVK
jgi:PKD repeat protein